MPPRADFVAPWYPTALTPRVSAEVDHHWPELKSRALLGGSPSNVGVTTISACPECAVPRGQFVVHDYLNGRHKKTLQEEKVAAAVDNTYMAAGPAAKPFYQTRTSFQPVTSLRWEQPLPAIADNGTPAITRRGAGPPESPRERGYVL